MSTSVHVRYLLRPSAATPQLIEDLWLGDVVTLVVSPELIAELENVLQRPKIRRYVAAEDAAVLVDALKARSMLLSSLAEIPPFTRDPKDDKFVACGLSGDAEYLVSYDDDLLVLGAVGDMKIGTPEAFARFAGYGNHLDGVRRLSRQGQTPYHAHDVVAAILG
jgi:putative PIN family toxin of toxin-antitoxin system